MTIYVNSMEIESFMFPGGEWQVNVGEILSKRREVYPWSVAIDAFLYSSADIMQLLLSVDAIKRYNLKSHIKLHLYYMPYARQDRVCQDGEALSIKVMADIINSMLLDEVVLYDPHSDVAPALINNCTAIDAVGILKENPLVNVIKSFDYFLVSPDAGAEKKVNALAKHLCSMKWTGEVIYASKKRDLATGNITDTTIINPLKCKNALIVDDICDGGRTFIELAKKLKESGTENVYLYVTHGIFSKGLEVLTPYIKHVYCYHTFLTEYDKDFLTVIRIT